MTKRYPYSLIAIVALGTISLANCMDAELTKLKQEEGLRAHITLAIHPTAPITYGVTPKWSEEEPHYQAKISPYIPVKLIAGNYVNEATQKQFPELNMAYYPSTFPLTALMKQGKQINGFLQLGPVADDYGRHSLNLLAVFTKKNNFVTCSSYDGRVYFDKDNHHTIPATFTFNNENFNELIEQKVEDFKARPTINSKPLSGTKKALQLAISTEVLEQTSSGLQHGRFGWPEKRKFKQFTKEVESSGNVFTVIQNRQYGNRFKRQHLNSHITPTTTTTTTTKSTTEQHA